MNIRNLTALLFVFLITGCKPYAYFNSPNDLSNKDCIVYLTNGTEKKGKLTIQFETGQHSDTLIHLFTESNAEEKILIDSVKFYKLNNEFYYPKKIDLEAYEVPNKADLYLPDVRNIVFVKRLTRENSKMSFFELYQSRLRSFDGQEHYSYFISFPNDHRLTAWSIRGNKFFPDFSEKMSKLVSDCPSLANKISEKSKGYFVNQISLDLRKLEIFKKIVSEYNDCK